MRRQSLQSRVRYTAEHLCVAIKEQRRCFCDFVFATQLNTYIFSHAMPVSSASLSKHRANVLCVAGLGIVITEDIEMYIDSNDTMMCTVFIDHQHQPPRPHYHYHHLHHP